MNGFVDHGHISYVACTILLLGLLRRWLDKDMNTDLLYFTLIFPLHYCLRCSYSRLLHIIRTLRPWYRFRIQHEDPMTRTSIC